MSHVAPPTRELAELVAALGDENVRSIVRTFLRDFPKLMSDLTAGERKDRHRIAHSMKSNSRLMGAHWLSKKMEELETRLSTENGGDVASEDLVAIRRGFAEIAEPLRTFAGV